MNDRQMQRHYTMNGESCGATPETGPPRPFPDIVNVSDRASFWLLANDLSETITSS